MNLDPPQGADTFVDHESYPMANPPHLPIASREKNNPLAFIDARV